MSEYNLIRRARTSLLAAMDTIDREGAAALAEAWNTELGDHYAGWSGLTIDGTTTTTITARVTVTGEGWADPSTFTAHCDFGRITGTTWTPTGGPRRRWHGGGDHGSNHLIDTLNSIELYGDAEAADEIARTWTAQIERMGRACCILREEARDYDVTIDVAHNREEAPEGYAISFGCANPMRTDLEFTVHCSAKTTR